MALISPCSSLCHPWLQNPTRSRGKQGQQRPFPALPVPKTPSWKGSFGQREVRKFWFGNKGGRGNCILYSETAWSWNPQQQRLYCEPSLQSHLIAFGAEAAQEAAQTHLPSSRESSALSIGAGFNIHIYKSTNFNAASKNLLVFFFACKYAKNIDFKKDKALWKQWQLWFHVVCS